jgi:hypothetical protein
MGDFDGFGRRRMVQLRRRAVGDEPNIRCHNRANIMPGLGIPIDRNARSGGLNLRSSLPAHQTGPAEFPHPVVGQSKEPATDTWSNR